MKNQFLFLVEVAEVIQSKVGEPIVVTKVVVVVVTYMVAGEEVIKVLKGVLIIVFLIIR